MFNQKNEDKSLKYESLTIKEQMLGIKSSKALPDDFYEKVLECELSLKEKFDMEILGTLIQYYSLAVEHFGSIGDEKKCAEYNESLNLLFKQMEVKKYMKEGKNIELNAKKEKIIKKMKIAGKKVDFNVAKKIINEKENKQIKSGKSIILKEIFNQALSFKQKLEKKKKKYKLKLNLENINTSMIPTDKKSKKILPILKNKNDNNPINRKRISKSTKIKKNKNIFEESTINNNFQNSFKSEQKLFINDISKIKSKSKLNLNDISDEKTKNDFFESKDESEDLLSSFELNINDESSDGKINFVPKSSNVLPFVNKRDDITKFTEKKNFQKKIKSIISEYMKEYYTFYMKNTIDKIIKEYQKYSYNLSEDLITEEINYYNQERQMEYLRDEDDNEGYKEQIEAILENIKNEKGKKINDIYNKYNENIKLINDKYLHHSNDNFNYGQIEILQEKVKLEINSLFSFF